MHADLGPDDRDLVGEWIVDGAEVRASEVTSRIQWLIAERLERIASDGSGWEVLYRDSRDGRYWELTYPQSERHGGGPPRLSLTTRGAAREKYGLAAGW